jgi:hypothetical protein
MTTSQPILTARTIGETENTLRAVLGKVLSGTGLDYRRWVALTVASRAASPLPERELVERLKGALKIDDLTTTKVLDDLRSDDILGEQRDEVSTTPRGASLYQRLSDEVGRVTQQLWANLDADDLAAAYRVHSTIIERANELLAK